MFKDKTIVITGGTGSFGQAFLKKLLGESFGEVRIFSRDEKKQDELRNKLNHPGIKFYIGDVRDRNAVESVMKGADFVFHAAALKQVPSCEFFPLEAVKTNILGTENVLESAISNGVQKAVVLSTDKSVYPINAMGLTKALMEKVMVAKSRNVSPTGTILCGTRYGNVMASRGSVIPLFIQQIKNGQDLTLTNPDMTRFMMSLDDAVNLVLFAFINGQSGDIFVQKSPATTIAVLADAIRSLYGSESGTRIIGTRHGEKLYETLVNQEEMFKAEDLGDYYKIPADTRDLNYAKYFSEGWIEGREKDEYNSHNTYRLSLEETKELLLKLPEIQSDLSAWSS